MKTNKGIPRKGKGIFCIDNQGLPFGQSCYTDSFTDESFRNNIKWWVYVADVVSLIEGDDA